MHRIHSGFQSLILDNWIKSEALRKVHKSAHANNDLYVGHPEFEGFNAII